MTDVILFISLDYLFRLTVRAKVTNDLTFRHHVERSAQEYTVILYSQFPIRCSIHPGSLNKCAINLVNSCGVETVETDVIFVGPERWYRRPIILVVETPLQSGFESARSTKGPKRKCPLKGGFIHQVVLFYSCMKLRMERKCISRSWDCPIDVE